MPKLTEPQQRWIDALRSGKYKQGKKRLQAEHTVGSASAWTIGVTEDRFCCLGVACHLFKDELDLTVRRFLTEVQYCGSSTMPPRAVVDYLDLVSDTGAPRIQISINDSSRHLMTLNDERGMSFEEIADLLESGDYFTTGDTHVEPN